MQSASEYKPYIIKEYKYWTLLLHRDRATPFIGRAVAWWKDRRPGEGEGMTPLDLAEPQVKELFRKVYRDVCRGCRALGYAVDALGSEFLINTSYLANEESHNHHMHWHFVPRWRQPFHMDVMGGKIVVDPEWGRHYHGAYTKNPTCTFSLPEERLQNIRHIMAKAID